jgi:hypothetical protein
MAPSSGAPRGGSLLRGERGYCTVNELFPWEAPSTKISTE